jgi:hypothetical protein
MNTLADLLNLVITTIQNRPVCRSTRVLETHSFSARQFALKVRAELIAGGVLQVRLYCNGDHTDYAYHLIHGEQSVR